MAGIKRELDGKVVYLDPGRFYRRDRLEEEAGRSREWWKALHRLQKWLLEQDPDLAVLCLS